MSPTWVRNIRTTSAPRLTVLKGAGELDSLEVARARLKDRREDVPERFLPQEIKASLEVLREPIAEVGVNRRDRHHDRSRGDVHWSFRERMGTAGSTSRMSARTRLALVSKFLRGMAGGAEREPVTALYAGARIGSTNYVDAGGPARHGPGRARPPARRCAGRAPSARPRSGRAGGPSRRRAPRGVGPRPARCPGLPTTVEFGGMSWTTTALAPIFAPWPIRIGPSSLAPEPIVTLSSTVGWRLPWRSRCRRA